MKGKNFWILLMFILCGLVVGGLLGDLASKIDGLWWLAYGQTFGITSPLELDLSIIKFTFAFLIKINVASILGMAIAVFIYRKV